MTKKEDRPNIWPNIFKYVRSYILWAVFAAGATVMVSLLEVLKADLLSGIIDAAQSGAAREIMRMFAAAAAVMAAIMLCVFLSRLCAGKFSAGIIHDIKRDSARRISKIPMDYMNSNRSGEMLSKMSADADTVQSFMENDFIALIQLPFTILFYSVYLIRLNPALFAACFLPLCVLVPLGAVFAVPFRTASKKYMKYLGRVSNTVADMVGGISVVKSYNMESEIAGKYNAGIKRATDMAINNDKIQYKGSFFFSLSRHVPVYICLLLGGYLCFKGSLTLGGLIAFSTLLSQTLSPLIRTSQLFFSLRAASASAERLFSIINEPTESDDGKVLKQLPEGKAAIEFKNVEFGYDRDRPVLKKLDLSVGLRETVGLAGASGCGKSTLLGLVCGFYRPSGGSVLIGGEADINLSSMRSLISYVSQEAYLFPFTIYENIAMGKPGASREEVIAAAKAAYAHEFILNTENGYNTVVGERGCRLSGGQVQRISIARAILKNAPILLLDEATSALDIHAEAEVQKAVDNLSRGRTVLVVAHRLSTIKNADRIAVIDDGRVKECGSHDELMRLGGIYSRLYSLSADKDGE